MIVFSFRRHFAGINIRVKHKIIINYIYQKGHGIIMTLIDDIEMKCSVCGRTSPQPILMSTNTMGYPDLDLRPAEMQRSTMSTWILECPHCGYVSSSLDNDAKIGKAFLRSDSYINCDGYDFKGRLSKRFYRSYLISKELGNTRGCFLNLQRCAWDCDDHDDENSAAIRRKAVEYADELIGRGDEAKNNLLVIKSDFMRRGGQFDEVIEEYSNLIIGEDILDKIIRFEVEKAKENDTECYTVEDVVG
jgi:hypothetical protein